MLGNWFLLLLMLPGWCLPSGSSVPLCGCLWSITETRSCCAPVEVESCCSSAQDEPESDDGSAPCIASGESCRCSVAVPAHDGGQAVSIVTRVAPRAPTFADDAPRVVPAGTVTAPRANPDRPRGPSPGAPNPLPLRL